MVSRATVCLNMIVKDEARVIRRCLDSVRPFIDQWLIVDTGSSDATGDIIRAELADLPGELVERPWRDFGHNRTEALELAQGRADYTLIIDADEVLLPAPGFVFPPLGADAYRTVHVAGESGTSFYLTQIVRSALPWRYEGVLHEVIACDEPHTVENLDGLVCKGFFDSARNVDPVQKYTQDARVLEAALADEPDNARYAFYLAQSYRDSRQHERAIEAYQRRAAMGGWAEEVWYSLFQIGVLRERQDDRFGPALEAYLAAYQYRPTRAEPLCALARHYRETGEHALAHLFARRAAELPRPEDILFLDTSVYDWRAQDELSVAAYYMGHYEDALALSNRLLGSPALPERERARIEKNRDFAQQKLGGTERKQRNRDKRKRRRR